MNDEELFGKVYDRMSWFAGGYAYGLFGEANIAWLKDQAYGDLFWYGNIYRLGYAATFDTPKIMTEEIRSKLNQFLEDTEGLEDYPIIDEEYYHIVVKRAEEKFVEWFASCYKLDESAVWDYMNENGIHLEADGDGVYPDWSDEVEAVTGIKRLSQTWDAHYLGGMFHDDTVCGYCEEQKTFEQSNKVEV